MKIGNSLIFNPNLKSSAILARDHGLFLFIKGKTYKFMFRFLN